MLDASRYEVTLPTSFFSETTKEIVREAAADAPTFLGIGVETAMGFAAGGGAVALGVGGFRLLKSLLSKDRTDATTSNQNITREVAAEPAAPFPRYLDEATELRNLRQSTEGRIPEYDTLVGRVVQDEITLRSQRGSEETKKVLDEFWLAVRDRVDGIAPPSTREYQQPKE